MRVKAAAALVSGFLCALPVLAAPPPDAGTVRFEEVQFSSHGIALSGCVALPAREEPRVAIVFIHGSGKQTRNLQWTEAFPWICRSSG
jgi:hypothetical protein